MQSWLIRLIVAILLPLGGISVAGEADRPERCSAAHVRRPGIGARGYPSCQRGNHQLLALTRRPCTPANNTRLIRSWHMPSGAIDFLRMKCAITPAWSSSMNG